VQRPRDLTPKIVLEGTRLTHKTDLAFALHEHPEVTGARRYRYHFPLVSAEWATLSPEPWGASLISFTPDLREAAVVGYDAWVALFRAHRHYPWIVDRFHLSTQVHQAAAGTPIDLAHVDGRSPSWGSASSTACAGRTRSPRPARSGCSCRATPRSTTTSTSSSGSRRR
jgi:hypothetical protein